MHRPCGAMLVLALVLGLVAAAGAGAADMRNIEMGNVIPSISYADQPYIVVMDDSAWVCTLTTGLGHEGKSGQHIIAARSTDQGKTWSEPVAIEPHTGPEASWVVPLLTDYGRIYAFYTYNGDRVHIKRDDTHGWYAFKYSDDGGRTWCAETHRLPYRLTACDQVEVDGAIVPHFWGICKPIVVDGTVYFSFTKLRKYFLEDGEGWLFKSDNVMTEPDLEKIDWGMLPEGEHGIRHPDYGSVQEEHNLAALSKPGELICVYRTTLGYPAVSYTRDGGATWSQPEPMRYSPGGRIIRTPRACPKIWRCENGKFLFWFHNHGGQDFNDRNPVWIVGGIEKDGVVLWSQPEVLLYHDDPKVRMSYPDLIEVDGEYYVTETQKDVARVHHIDKTLLEGMWTQLDEKVLTESPKAMESHLSGMMSAGKKIGMDWEWKGGPDQKEHWNFNIPNLPSLKAGGWTVEFTMSRLENLDSELTLLDARDGQGKGIAVTAVPGPEGTGYAVRIDFGDGERQATWDTDPGVLLGSLIYHQIAFIVDGGPNLITVVVDGKLCDGSLKRQWGFGRFSPEMDNVNGANWMTVHPAVGFVNIYGRYLRTAEVVSNYAAARRHDHLMWLHDVLPY